MKTSELNLKTDGYLFNTNEAPARSHYKFLMSIGRRFPSTKEQAKYFVKNQIVFDVLNMDSAIKIDTLMKKHGFEGDFKYTKSQTSVRLQNHNDFYTTLKLEFNL
jgi:hypothetical protein